MDDLHLYQQIIESIREEILSGTLKPGDRLPSVRKMTVKWDCTNATVLRAYQELARQGLIVSRVGQGTKVNDKLPIPAQMPLRRAMLQNRIEASILEIMSAGYSPDEVEQATRVALDRWRTISTEPDENPPNILRFVGSHDPAMALIAAHYPEVTPGYILKLSFTGSLGGLIALAEKKADLAGCHLWDENTNTYNEPFVRKLLPGQRIVMLTLAHRRVGLILSPGNPHGINSLADLANVGARFVNRQQGSGTRVWLDAQLNRMGIDPARISGFLDEKLTHSEVARAISKGQADVGLGVETAALSFGLDFKLLTTERYDLIIPSDKWVLDSVQALKCWLDTDQAKASIQNLGGYDVNETCHIEWVE